MLRALLILLAFVTSAALAVYSVGGTLCQAATASIGKPPEDVAFKAVSLQTPNGQKVAGWFLPGQPGAGAVLLVHGIRGSRLDMVGRARFLARAGHAVLLIDLPAHGESPAQHITFGLHEAHGVKAAFAFLEQQLPGEKIGAIGVSLGAASLVFAAPDIAPSALVLESMYPTITEAVEDRLRLHFGPTAQALAPLLLWQLPWRLGITPEQLRPIEVLPSIRVPMLIAAGSIDQHTTIAETRRLFSAARQPKALWLVEGAAHEDLHAFHRAAYEAKILAFLAQHLRTSGARDKPAQGQPMAL